MMLKTIHLIKKKINKRYLLKLILSYLILATVFVIIVASVLFNISNNIIREEVGKSVDDIVMDNSFVIYEIMNDIKSAYSEELALGQILLTFLAENNLYYRSYDDSQKVLNVINLCNGVINASRYIDSIYIYHGGTRKVLANDRYIWNYEDMNYKSWIDEQFENGMPVFTAIRALDNSTPPRERFFYSYIGGFPPRRQSDRILVNLDVDAINKRLSKIGIRDSGFIFITDENGKILFHRDSSKLLTQFQIEKDTNDILSSISGQMVSEIDGERTLILHHTVQGLQWKVIAMIPLDEINNPIDMLRNITYITCLISLAIAIIFSLLLSNRIYGPLNSLLAEMKKVETGNFDVEVKHHRKDEFGYLYDRFNSMMEKIRALITDTYKLEIINKESQLKTLQTQINPHFLYNTLNTLYCMARDSSKDLLSSTIYKLTEYYKICLSEGDEAIYINHVLQQLVCYYEIEKVKRPGRLELIFKINPEVYPYKILKMLLQPIVENAFIHGVDPSKQVLRVTVTGVLEGNNIRFEIVDDGIGIKPEKLECLRRSIGGMEASAKNYALRNISSRIKLYYGENYNLEIFSEVSIGTRVVVTLPAKER